MISASVLESAMHACLLLIQWIGIPLSRMRTPVVDTRTDQSESLIPLSLACGVVEPCSPPFENVRPKCSVWAK